MRVCIGFIPQHIEQEAKKMEDSNRLSPTLYLQDVAKGRGRSQLEGLTLEGLELIHVGHGFIRCNLLITDRVSEGDGNWHVGAMATAMDAIGAVTVYSLGDGHHASVDFNASFYSTAKIQEKVEIEAKVVGRNGGLKSALIEIRSKGRGELIAIGRLWMAPRRLNPRNKVSQRSKL